MSGRIQAAYMLAPLVMDLTDKRIPLKIVSLGHRSGAVIMVRTDSANKSFKDLKGKRIAIPSRFAVDFRRSGPARRLRAPAVDDARPVAQLHLLRAHRARGTDP